jgi:hypothetical protein
MTEVFEQEAGVKGGFFAVDSRTWATLCVPGMLNEAVAYIVQARGTGRDNRTTTWSVESIERYTGISRHKAAAAVKNLQAKGFTRLLRGGTKPKYELAPFGELPGTADPRPPLSYPEKMAVNRVQRGFALSRNHRDQAGRAANKGWLVEHEGEFAIAPPPEIKPDLIWLPNELIDGAAGETPPLELVRQTQDPMTLRLIIDMYHAQNLREDGGVSRRLMWDEFIRVKIGEHAQFTVWGFHQGSSWVNWKNGLTLPHRRELTNEEKTAGKNKGLDFFQRTAYLGALRLIEWVPHLVESADECGEIIHPLCMGDSESIEDRLGRAAHKAGRALITEGQYGWAVEKGIHQLVPVPRHIANVQMIGIARLRYRPHTRMTTAWWADLKANAEKHLARYAEIAARQTTRVVV